MSPHCPSTWRITSSCFACQVSDELVEEWQQLFYGEVQRLWDKHQPTFPGYEDVSLVLSET